MDPISRLDDYNKAPPPPSSRTRTAPAAASSQQQQPRQKQQQQRRPQQQGGAAAPPQGAASRRPPNAAAHREPRGPGGGPAQPQQQPSRNGNAAKPKPPNQNQNRSAVPSQPRQPQNPTAGRASQQQVPTPPRPQRITTTDSYEEEVSMLTDEPPTPARNARAAPATATQPPPSHTTNNASGGGMLGNVVAYIMGSNREESDDEEDFVTAKGSKKDEDRDVVVEPIKPPDDDEVSIDFLQDKTQEMTLARKIAMTLASKYSWYNPVLTAKQESDTTEAASEKEPRKEQSVQEEEKPWLNANESYPFTKSKRETPSLEKAWAYYEHVALSRHVVEAKHRAQQQASVNKPFLTRLKDTFLKGDEQLSRAEPGENHLPTKLYDPIFTPHSQLGDWGLGMGLYFTTVRTLAILTFLAGTLNLTNMVYFHSAEYSGGQEGLEPFGVKGSAICTKTAWVPCIACDPSEFELDRHRFAYGIDVSGIGQDFPLQVSFALKNDCDGATMQQVGFNFATLIFIIVGIMALNMYSKHMEVQFDEDEQTAQDYSILVDNPPPDATDPKEWKKFFFENFDGAHTTAITIAVDNDMLVRTLVKRREVLRQLEMMVEPGTSLDLLTLAGLAAKEEKHRTFVGGVMAMVSPGVPELFAQLVVLNAKVSGLAQQDYPAKKVFVTFETEAAQRRVLSALSVGSLDASRNNVSKVANPKHLFRGKCVLAVEEPEEPSTMRWEDLNEKLLDRLKQQALTTLSTLVAVLIIAFLVNRLNDEGTAMATFAIAGFNTAFPMFAKFLTSLEAHSSESGKQRSLYFKISLFRWANTAIVITIITPFTSTLSLSDDDGLIPKIYALFYAEIVTSTAIQLLDVDGHFQRHFMAPRAKTQDAMNVCMQGSVMELAERYTNMTKILFLALWYSAIYPATLFFCSFTLMINYFVDRFSLMRTWKRAPKLGTTIAEFSRRYFFPLAIVAMALASSYYWSAFPFDNLCPASHSLSLYHGTWILNLTDGSQERVTVVEGDPMYGHCIQDFLRYPTGERAFPFVPLNQIEGKEWMTEEQETLTNMYGWSAVVIIILVAMSFLWSAHQWFVGLFRGTYEARGDDQGIPFSEVPSISTYIPEVHSPSYSYPLLACNVETFDEDLLEWTDPDRPHSYYDLTKDADVLLRGVDVSTKVVFSQVAHYPPEKKMK